MQRLVIPGRKPQELEVTSVKQHGILRHLSSIYLTPQELEFYDVESELRQLESEEDSDST